MTPARPPIVSADDWSAALAELTRQEEAVAAELDRLAAARKRMPMVAVDNDYRFDGPDGWPQAPMSYWMRRHDEFDEPAPSARD